MESLSGLLSNSKKINAECTIQTHYDGISDLSLNPVNKSLLAASCFDTTISIYDLNKKGEVSNLKGHEKGVWTINYKPNSEVLISGGSDAKAILWDTSSNTQITQLNKHMKSIYDVQFSHSGKYLASCSKDCICIWDSNKLDKPIDYITENKGELKDFIYCVNFLEDESNLVTGFIDGTLIIHKIGNKLEDDLHIQIPSKRKYTGLTEDVYNRSVFNIEPLNSDKNKFLLSHADGSVRLYEYKKNKIRMKDKYYYFTAPVTCARTNDDDTQIIASSKDRTAEVWTLGNHKGIDYTISWHKNIVSSALFYDKNKVATSSFDNSIKLWNLDKTNDFGAEL